MALQVARIFFSIVLAVHTTASLAYTFHPKKRHTLSVKSQPWLLQPH